MQQKSVPELHHRMSGCSHLWLYVQAEAGPQAYSSIPACSWPPSLACFPLSPRAAVRQTYTRLKHLPLCLSCSPPLQNRTSARLRDHTEAASAEGRVRAHSEESQAARHHVCTGPGHHLIPLKTSKWVSWSKFSYAYRYSVFLEQATKCLFASYVINHFFQFWVLSRSRECTLLWPWFLPLLLKWDQCWLSCLFQITKLILPFSDCIRPISSHSFLAGNSACAGDFDPGQLNISLKYFTC